MKGKRFNSWRSVGVAAQAVRIHQARGVDELVLLDIGATPERRGPDLDLIEELTQGCFMPLAVGGGIRTIGDVRSLLQAGADKVVLRTAGIAVIQECAKAVGCQAIVAAMDVTTMDDECVTPLSPAGHERLREIAVEHAKRLTAAGAGEILLTTVEREGMMQGYDCEMIAAVASAVDVPVIAHGGAGTYEHMHEAIKAGASAVAAGAMFQFTDQTPRGAAEYLASKGVEVRL